MAIARPDALALLETRRTIAFQEFAEPGPSEEELRRIVACAVRVPDHGKLTPWRFVVVRGDARAALDERLFALWQARFPDAPEGKRAQEKTRFAAAPLTILVISTAAEHVKIPLWEQELSAGAASMNLMLAAHAFGYAAQWLTTWIAYDRDALAVLGVKPEERLAALIPIGTPTVAPVERPRPAYEAVVTEWKA